MNTTLPKSLASLALVAALAMALALEWTGAVQAQSCLDNRQIQEAVAAGEIRSLDQVLASAGVDSAQSVLNVQVCDEGGNLVYVVGVLSPSGEAENLVLNAR